jgi:hypothetical protein
VKMRSFLSRMRDGIVDGGYERDLGCWKHISDAIGLLCNIMPTNTASQPALLPQRTRLTYQKKPPPRQAASSSPQHPIYQQHSPMLLLDINSIDINPILEPALLGLNLYIIPAHLPLPHPAILSKRPVFQAITTFPLHSIVFILVLIPELDSDLVVRESEQLLAQAASNYHQHMIVRQICWRKALPIRCFLLPLGSKELDDGFCTREEAVAVTPDGVFGVGFGDGGGVPWVVWSGLRSIKYCNVSSLTGCSRDPALSSLSPARSLL